MKLQKMGFSVIFVMLQYLEMFLETTKIFKGRERFTGLLSSKGVY
jgi:hypothetical protein